MRRISSFFCSSFSHEFDLRKQQQDPSNHMWSWCLRQSNKVCASECRLFRCASTQLDITVWFCLTYVVFCAFSSVKCLCAYEALSTFIIRCLKWYYTSMRMNFFFFFFLFLFPIPKKSRVFLISYFFRYHSHRTHGTHTRIRIQMFF